MYILPHWTVRTEDECTFIMLNAKFDTDSGYQGVRKICTEDK